MSIREQAVYLNKNKKGIHGLDHKITVAAT